MPVCKHIYTTHNNSCGDCTLPRQEHVYFTPRAQNVSARHFWSGECPLLFTLFTRDWKREREKLISPIVSIWRRRSWSLQSILRWGLGHHHHHIHFLYFFLCETSCFIWFSLECIMTKMWDVAYTLISAFLERILRKNWIVSLHSYKSSKERDKGAPIARHFEWECIYITYFYIM